MTDQPQILEAVIINDEQEKTEEQEIEEIKKEEPKIKYRTSPKFERWLQFFLDNGNKLGKKTFGNATQSAIHAYQLDPQTQYFSAAVIGKKNTKKVKNLGALYLDKNGVNYGKMYDVLFNKMLTSNSPDLWFMIMQILGFEVPDFKPISNPFVYINNKKEVHLEGGDTQLAKLTDDELNNLIETKARQIGSPQINGGESTANQNSSIEVHSPTRETISGDNQ